LWTSGGGQLVGWFDMKKYDETGDAVKAQGWTPMILDTNGKGKRDAGCILTLSRLTSPPSLPHVH
jgi:hypothetical protein